MLFNLDKYLPMIQDKNHVKTKNNNNIHYTWYSLRETYMNVSNMEMIPINLIRDIFFFY